MSLRDIVKLVNPTAITVDGPTLLLVGTTITLLWLVRNRYRSNLQSVPGPFLNSISVLPRMFSVYSGRSQHDDLLMHQKYGRVVRVAPNAVITSDLSHIDVLYGVNTKFFKGGFYEPTRFHDEEGLLPDPFVLADKAMHTRMKRNASNAYSLQALVQLEPLVDEVVKSLFDHLDEKYATTQQTCDMGKYMLYFAVDAIFTVTFGKNMDLIRTGATAAFLKTLADGLPYISVVGQIPWAHKYLLGNKYVGMVLNAGAGDSLMTPIMNIAISQRIAAEKELGDDDDPDAPCTFLMRLLRNQIKNPAIITDRELNTHTFGNIIAGGDTTSTAVRAIIYNLIRHPQALTRMLQELRAAGLDKGGPVVSFSTAQQLPYLTAICREAMRLHPSVGMVLPREVPAGGINLTTSDNKEYFIGPGIEIGMNPWVVNRDPEVFPEPESFKPERWLNSDPEHLARMNRAWMTFGAGRHTCSGQHISMLEITKLIPSLFLRYNMVWEHGAPDIVVKNYFFTMQSGLSMTIERREQEVMVEKVPGPNPVISPLARMPLISSTA